MQTRKRGKILSELQARNVGCRDAADCRYVLSVRRKQQAQEHVSRHTDNNTLRPRKNEKINFISSRQGEIEA